MIASHVHNDGGAAVLFINQLRQKLGVVFGKPETARDQNTGSDGSSLGVVCLGPWPAAQLRAIEEAVAEVEHSAMVLLHAVEDLFDALEGAGACTVPEA